MSAVWRTSSYSGYNGNCVQVLMPPGTVLVRDSKDHSSPVLEFTRAEWAEFVAGVKSKPQDLVPGGTGRLSFPDGELHLPPLPRRVRRLPVGYVDEDPPI